MGGRSTDTTWGAGSNFLLSDCCFTAASTTRQSCHIPAAHGHSLADATAHAALVHWTTCVARLRLRLRPPCRGCGGRPERWHPVAGRTRTRAWWGRPAAERGRARAASGGPAQWCVLSRRHDAATCHRPGCQAPVTAQPEQCRASNSHSNASQRRPGACSGSGLLRRRRTRQCMEFPLQARWAAAHNAGWLGASGAHVHVHGHPAIATMIHMCRCDGHEGQEGQQPGHGDHCDLTGLQMQSFHCQFITRCVNEQARIRPGRRVHLQPGRPLPLPHRNRALSFQARLAVNIVIQLHNYNQYRDLLPCAASDLPGSTLAPRPPKHLRQPSQTPLASQDAALTAEDRPPRGFSPRAGCRAPRALGRRARLWQPVP